ncbi:MAG: hypothetical protein V7752_11535 [Halopseudomonas sp.]
MLPLLAAMTGCTSSGTSSQSVTVVPQGLRTLVDEVCHQRMRILTGFDWNELTEDEAIDRRRFEQQGYDAVFRECKASRMQWLDPHRR